MSWISGVTKYLGGTGALASGSGANTIPGAIGNSFINNVVSQGARMALHGQDHFDWGSLRSSIFAGVADVGVNSAFDPTASWDTAGGFASHLANNVANAAVDAKVNQLVMHRDRIDWASAAGNAIASTFTGYMERNTKPVNNPGFLGDMWGAIQGALQGPGTSMPLGSAGVGRPGSHIANQAQADTVAQENAMVDYTTFHIGANGQASFGILDAVNDGPDYLSGSFGMAMTSEHLANLPTPWGYLNLQPIDPASVAKSPSPWVKANAAFTNLALQYYDYANQVYSDDTFARNLYDTRLQVNPNEQPAVYTMLQMAGAYNDGFDALSYDEARAAMINNLYTVSSNAYTKSLLANQGERVFSGFLQATTDITSARFDKNIPMNDYFSQQGLVDRTGIVLAQFALDIKDAGIGIYHMATGLQSAMFGAVLDPVGTFSKVQDGANQLSALGSTLGILAQDPRVLGVLADFGRNYYSSGNMAEVGSTLTGIVVGPALKGLEAVRGSAALSGMLDELAGLAKTLDIGQFMARQSGGPMTAMDMLLSPLRSGTKFIVEPGPGGAPVVAVTDLFRGGNSLTARIGVDVNLASDGLIYPLNKKGKPQGLSININPKDKNIQKHDGAFPIISSLPEGLQLIQHGNPGHYLVSPAGPMTYEKYQELLNNIQLGNHNVLP